LHTTLCKILPNVFNTLAEPQVCVTCPSFLPLIRGVVSEGVLGSEITAQGRLPARDSPLGLGRSRRDRLTEGRPQPASGKNPDLALEAAFAATDGRVD